MSDAALDAAFRAASGRIIAALAVRFRDLDLAEEAFAEACARAARAWTFAPPRDPNAWLYRTAERAALDALRRRRVRDTAALDEPDALPSPEEALMNADDTIPDERLRLIFVCCHPAIAAEARAPLTLKLVCGLSTREIARAFLVSEATLAQRLVRAKRKIAGAGIRFEIPAAADFAARLGAVLSTIEIAYAKAHEDACGTGAHAGFAIEVLALTDVLRALIPHEPEVAALAALVRFAEARRPARVDAEGIMIPLAEQDPARWNATLIAAARPHLAYALARPPLRQLTIRALIHAEWCGRTSLEEPPPWPYVLTLYDALLSMRDDAVARLNRAVALAEVAGPEAALAEVEALAAPALADFLPWHAVRADLLARVGRCAEASEAYDRALALEPGEAERRWLEGKQVSLRDLSPPTERWGRA